MQERRRYKREVLTKYLHVFDLETGKVLGFLGDISPHGLMLIGEEKLPAGQMYPLGMYPYTLESDAHYINPEEQEHLPFWAEVRWSRPLDECLWSTGFMLADGQPDIEQTIETLIQSVGRTEQPPNQPRARLEILLCLDDVPEASKMEEIGCGLIKQPGMISVTLEPDTPHLSVVQYYPEHITPEQIIAYVQSLGYPARYF